MTGPNRVRASLSNVLKVELLIKDKETVVSQYYKIEDGYGYWGNNQFLKN